MRKHFLILMLLTLLPMATWAIDISGYHVTIQKNSFVYGQDIEAIGTGLDFKVYATNVVDPVSPTQYTVRYYQGSTLLTAKPKNVGTYTVKAIGSEGEETAEYATFTITPKALSYTLKAENYDNFAAVYRQDAIDKQIEAADIVLTGAEYGESVTDLFTIANDAAWSYTGTDANYNSDGSAALVGGATYAVTLSGITEKAAAANYTITYTTNYMKIKQAVIDFSQAAVFIPSNGTNPVVVTPEYTYDGKAKTPAYTIKYVYGTGDTDFETLAAGTDFNVTYAKNGTGFVSAILADETYNYEASAATKDDAAKPNFVVTATAANAKLGEFVINKRNLTIQLAKAEKPYDGLEGDLTKIGVTYPGLALTDVASAKDLFNGAITVAFDDEAANHKDVKEYDIKVTVSTTTGNGAVLNNYRYDVTATSCKGKFYEIKARKVTVKAKKQIVTYTGSAIATDATSATRADAGNKIWLKVVKDVTGDVPVDGTVIIEDATYDTTDPTKLISTTGVLNGDDVTGIITLTKDAEQTINAQGTYEDAIIVGQTAAVSNYEIVEDKSGEYGDVLVDFATYTVTVDWTTKTYGEAVTQADFKYIPAGTLKGTQVYDLYEEDANSNLVQVPTDKWSKLDAKTYVVRMRHDATMAPDNYKLVEGESYIDGYLIIEKADLTITPQAQIIGKNADKTALRDLVTIAGLVAGDEGKIAYELDFNIGDAEGKIPAANTETTAGVTKVITAGTYAKGIKVTAPATAEDKMNKNYNINVDATASLVVTDAAYRPVITIDVDGDVPAQLAANDNASNVDVKISFDNRTRAYKTGDTEYGWTAEKWNTLVLPFDITVADLSKALGYAIVNVINPDKTVIDGENSKVYGKLTMKGGNGSNDVLAANKPFMVKTAQNITGYVTFENVTIKAPASVADCTVDAGKGVKFIGTYAEKTVSATDDGKIWFMEGDEAEWATIYAGSTSTWTLVPFEGYVDLNEAAGARGITFVLEELDGSTTAITSVNADAKNSKFAEGVYTLNGVKLQSMPTEKGVYILNGKKFVVK